MASTRPQLIRGLLIAAAIVVAAPACASPGVGAPSAPIDTPGHGLLEPIGADAYAYAATTAGEGGFDPLAFTTRLVGEYQAMPQRQRLAVLASLGTAFIVLIGSALLALERRAVAVARPTRAPAAQVAQVAAPPTRALIGDLGRAIRQAAETEAAAEAGKVDAPVDAPVETGRPRSLESYFAEIEALRRARRGVSPSAGAAAGDSEAPATKPRPGGGFRVSDYPSARRRARTRLRAERTEHATVETPLPTQPLNAPIGDAEASKLFVVREIGRQQTEARRLRERDAATQRGKPGSSA